MSIFSIPVSALRHELHNQSFSVARLAGRWNSRTSTGLKELGSGKAGGQSWCVFDDVDSVCVICFQHWKPFHAGFARVHTLAPEIPHGQCEVPMICASSQWGVEEIHLGILGFIGCWKQPPHWITMHLADSHSCLLLFHSTVSLSSVWDAAESVCWRVSKNL